MNLQEVIAANKATASRADELNIRAGEILFPVMDRDTLAAWLTSRLNGARCVAEVKDFSALLFPPLPQEVVNQVLVKNPDTITLCGKTYPVQYYPLHDDGDVRLPRITMHLEEYQRVWRDLPDEGVFLPGGKPVEIGVMFPAFGDTLFGQDIPTLKKHCAARLNDSVWDAWHRQEFRPIIPLPDPTDPASVVPEIVRCFYGTSTLDGSLLIAYGVAHPVSHRHYETDPWFRGYWYRLKEEAELAYTKSVNRLEELRSAAILQKKQEEMRTAVMATQRTLRQLLIHADWLAFSLQRADLSQRVMSYAHSYIHFPFESLNDLEIWLREARATANEAERALNVFALERSQAATRTQVSTSVAALQAKFGGGRHQHKRR